MAITRTAVDKKTQDYWSEYFGDYGKLFVRDIPRTIKNAALKEFRRSAARGDRTLHKSEVVPLGYRVTASGGLSLDGVLRVDYSSGNKRRTASRLFNAQFSASGKLLKLDSRPAPGS